MNKFICIGNLTKDPEIKTVANKSTTTFTVAVKRDFTDKTDFFLVSAWDKLAEVCVQHLFKGSRVAILGRLQNRSWEDKNGNKHTMTEVVADTVEFLSPRVSEVNSEKPDIPDNQTAMDLPF